MGIYDRDWVQNRGGSRGTGGGFPTGGRVPGQGLRSLSVTHWLIIACALIYFVEGFARPAGEQLKNPSSWTLVSLEHSQRLGGSLRV
ncbi:MAG: hypothetical protein VXX30_01490, partial [Planctomycetota bacterium]|nr:hypothetical protein [Planctomycetota bacterium]